MVKVKYPSITPPIAVFLFFFFMFMLDVLRVFRFASLLLPSFQWKSVPPTVRQANAQLVFGNNWRNFPGFMIGRQLTVVASFFAVSAITGLNIPPNGRENNIFGISNSAQKFLIFGFHGAVITTIVASITWQYAASAFPIAGMNNPVTFIHGSLSMHTTPTLDCWQ
jgi:hypothetical protein